MFRPFLTFINHLGLDLHQQRTLLTVSGGIDSVVMAHLFQRAGFEAGIAHCNFGLRGEESVMDEDFVHSLADEYGFQFFVKHFETKAYAKTRGISTQMAARDLRYDWFEEVRKDSFDWIATAHHVNDSLETVLLNLTRGTGVAGLCGISPVNGSLLRPMLFATKEDILRYAEEHHLSWREDRSNESLDYKRNVIRKKVVPVLKELNPSVEATFQVTSEKVLAANALLAGFLDEWKNSVVVNAGTHVSIPMDSLLGKANASYLLWSVLEIYGFSYLQCTQICSGLDSISGATFFSDTHQLLRERAWLVVRGRVEKKVQEAFEIGGAGEYNIGNATFLIEECESSLVSRADAQVIFIDAAKIKFPLEIRNWKHGDIFFPFGMKGKRKKVSDVLIDLKYSLFQKEEVKVLVDQEGEIIWLVGIRADERWRIEENTRKCYKITHILPGVDEKIL